MIAQVDVIGEQTVIAGQQQNGMLLEEICQQILSSEGPEGTVLTLKHVEDGEEPDLRLV